MPALFPPIPFIFPIAYAKIPAVGSNGEIGFLSYIPPKAPANAAPPKRMATLVPCQSISYGITVGFDPHLR